MRFPEVSVRAADAALKKLAPAVGKIRGVHITVDTGASPCDWEKLRQVAFILLTGLAKSKILGSMTIDGVFSYPRKEQMDWLSGKRIITRYLLGSGLGFRDEIDTEAAKTLKAISEHGLRIPVLLYWSGQEGNEVKGLLIKALGLNKLAGVGILPYFLSPRFDSQAMMPGACGGNFSEVLSFLHSDRLLSEFLEDPSGDIEERMAGAASARCVCGVITETSDIEPFRCFPFVAYGHRRQKLKSIAFQKLSKTSMSGRCGRCAWKYICGGVDCAPSVLRQQYKVIVDDWCANRKVLMQRIVLECLEIREHLYQFKDRLLKDAI